MIFKFQACVFICFGVMAWHGIDELVLDAKRQGKIEIIFNASIEALPHISTRDL